MIKYCKRCNEEKSTEEFSNNRRSKDGFDLYCKKCNSLRVAKSKPDYHVELYKQFYNIEKCSMCGDFKSKDNFRRKEKLCSVCVKIKDKEFYYKNKDRYNRQSREYRVKNLDKQNAYHKEYRNKNKNKIKEYCEGDIGRETRRAYSRKYYHAKKKLSLKFKISDRISSSIRANLSEGKRYRHWEDIIGYKFTDLKIELEKKLHEPAHLESLVGKNYHIDHIIPIAYFDFNSISDFEFFLAFDLENFQLLSAIENIKKSDNLSHESQSERLKLVEFYKKYPEMYRTWHTFG